MFFLNKIRYYTATVKSHTNTGPNLNYFDINIIKKCLFRCSWYSNTNKM